MKNILEIITAIGDQSLNNALRFESEIEIPEKDILYREGVLEYLEKNNKIDLIILYEKIPGEIDFINLVKKIKLKNNNIEIFFVLENKNEEFEKLLNLENIKNIYYINEININTFINKIKNLNNKNDLNEEIKKLKNIINEKNEELLKYKNNNLLTDNFNNKKYIAIIGEEYSGKTLIINNLKNTIENINLFEFKEININNYLEIENINNICNKLVFIIENQIEKIIRNKKIINKLIYENKINLKNIYIIFNKINKYSPNNKISSDLYKEFNIIGRIKLNNYCDYVINEKNSFNKENKKLKNVYNKIFNKISFDT